MSGYKRHEHGERRRLIVPRHRGRARAARVHPPARRLGRAGGGAAAHGARVAARGRGAAALPAAARGARRRAEPRAERRRRAAAARGRGGGGARGGERRARAVAAAGLDFGEFTRLVKDIVAHQEARTAEALATAEVAAAALSARRRPLGGIDPQELSAALSAMGVPGDAATAQAIAAYGEGHRALNVAEFTTLRGVIAAQKTEAALAGLTAASRTAPPSIASTRTRPGRSRRRSCSFSPSPR